MTPREIPDMPPPPGEHPYYWDVQLALHYGYMTLITKGGVTGFYPDTAMTGAGVDAAVIKWLKARFPKSDWAMLTALKNGAWQPSPGWRPTVPSYFAAEIAARELGLRFNHPTGADGLEVLPEQRDGPRRGGLRAAPGRRGDRLHAAVHPARVRHRDPAGAERPPAAGAAVRAQVRGLPLRMGRRMAHHGLTVRVAGLGRLRLQRLHLLRDAVPLRLPGHGTRRPRPGGSGQAAHQPGKLLPGDLIFFGYHGTKSAVIEIYHAALYMGNGWFIQSTGSTDGVSIANLNDPYNNYWRTYFAWGRRLLSPAELAE